MKTLRAKVWEHDGGWLRLEDPLPEGLKRGASIRVTIEDERSHRQHNLFWGMLRYTAEHSDKWASAEEVLLWLKTQLGLYRVVQLGDRAMLDFKSISFRAMSAKRFGGFLDQSVKLLSETCGFDPLAFYEGDLGWTTKA